MDGASNENYKLKSKTFRKFIDPLTDNELSRGVQRYFTDENLDFDLNTLITDDQGSSMVLNLIRSDRVFVDLRNDDNFPNVDFFPVEVLRNTFRPLKTENSELPQYTVKVRFAFEQISR